MDWYIVVLLVVLILSIVKIYFVLTCSRCTSKRRLDGKTVLVTGGSTGIGYYSAKDFARRGARVIIASSNERNYTRARDEIIKQTGNKNVVAKYLDLSSFEVVRAFAKDILENEERLDILVNNAGTFGPVHQRTKDGLLLELQVNYFGPFLLTHLLIGLLMKTKGSRIVNVSSVLSQFAVCNIDDIDSVPEPFFSDFFLYNNSKLFLNYMTWEFADRLKGSGVTVNCLHPGVVDTEIIRKNKFLYNLMSLVVKIYSKNPEEGAQTIIHLAVSEEVEGVTGKYFQECKPYRPLIKKNKNTIKKVWDKSIELVKLSPEEIQI